MGNCASSQSARGVNGPNEPPRPTPVPATLITLEALLQSEESNSRLALQIFAEVENRLQTIYPLLASPAFIARRRGVVIPLTHYCLVYSKQLMPVLEGGGERLGEWRYAWHITPSSVHEIHNINPERYGPEFLFVSQGTQSYCTVKDEAIRRAIYDELTNKVANNAVNVILDEY